ncbi:hypothetical protein [Haladaptatus halobius]|uniref:hypothetical protein n=1 Tax=Haladaptatus halobius TaxID=2884875 RepID=UPI001D09FAB0|nr:hypothetical protein [Haladaptatus halobius]
MASRERERGERNRDERDRRERTVVTNDVGSPVPVASSAQVGLLPESFHRKVASSVSFRGGSLRWRVDGR